MTINCGGVGASKEQLVAISGSDVLRLVVQQRRSGRTTVTVNLRVQRWDGYANDTPGFMLDVRDVRIVAQALTQLADSLEGGKR
jgi:hypothetical protein